MRESKEMFDNCSIKLVFSENASDVIGFEDSIHPPLGVGILDQVFQTFSKFTIWDDGRWMMKFESNPKLLRNVIWGCHHFWSLSRSKINDGCIR